MFLTRTENDIDLQETIERIFRNIKINSDDFNLLQSLYDEKTLKYHCLFFAIFQSMFPQIASGLPLKQPQKEGKLLHFKVHEEKEEYIIQIDFEP